MEVRLDDAGVEGVGRYARVAQAVVQGAGVDYGGEFGVALAFPDGHRCQRWWDG